MANGNGSALVAENIKARLSSQAFLKFAASDSGLDEQRVASIIRDYAAEMDLGLKTLGEVTLIDRRLLEVGAGIGLLSIALWRAGFAVTALEPGANGFDDNARLGVAVRKWLDAGDLPFLDIGAAELDPATHGSFDVIFSMNVLEHIPELAAAVGAMERVLAPNGVMVHNCPNYAVPYDPHFGIILLPGAPRLTERLLPRLAQNGVWKSLNFVSAAKIRRLGRDRGLVVKFRPAMMYEAFRRIDEDEAFNARHQGLVSRVQRVLKRTGLLRLLRLVPAPLATPMTFEWRRP